MSRIRSIKPDFWTSEQILECSLNARLLFIGLWNFCDDAGRHPFSAKQVKAEVFPAEDMSSENVLGLLRELSENDLIRVYVVDNKEYCYVTGWKHQRIDKPQQPRYPEPNENHSTNVLGTLPPDRIGKDKIGEDKKGKNSSANAPTEYGFEGQLVRVTSAQVDKWKLAHPGIDVMAELRLADAYYTESPAKDGKWFFAVASWLERAGKRSAEEKSKRGSPDKNGNYPGDVNYGVDY